MHIMNGIQMDGRCEFVMIGYDPTGQLILLDPFIIGEESIIDENRLFLDDRTKSFGSLHWMSVSLD